MYKALSFLKEEHGFFGQSFEVVSKQHIVELHKVQGFSVAALTVR